MILPTIITITSDWRKMIEEADKLGLKEINAFLTCLNKEERKEFYELLKKTKLAKIPFVHLRSDMEPWELDFLAENYKTEIYNIHTEREYPLEFDYGERKKRIYIENIYEPLDEEEIKRFAGICLDFAHLENSRIFKPDLYRHNIKMIEKYGCGCNHISPEVKFSLYDKKERLEEKHPHTLKNLSQLDYLKRYPARYFSPFIAMEMENTIKEQLRAIEYIKEILYPLDKVFGS